MTQATSLLETITPILTSEGLRCIRTGNGRDSQFWSTNLRDTLTIRVQEGSVALVYTITYDNPSEKSHPLVLKRVEDNTPMLVTTPEDFSKVKDEWIARVKRGF